jgi:hypothetical protein
MICAMLFFLVYGYDNVVLMYIQQVCDACPSLWQAYCDLALYLTCST